MGKPPKHKLIVDYIRRESEDIVCLEETKLSDLTPSVLWDLSHAQTSSSSLRIQMGASRGIMLDFNTRIFDYWHTCGGLLFWPSCCVGKWTIGHNWLWQYTTLIVANQNLYYGKKMLKFALRGTSHGLLEETSTLSDSQMKDEEEITIMRIGINSINL